MARKRCQFLIRIGRRAESEVAAAPAQAEGGDPALGHGTGSYIFQTIVRGEAVLHPIRSAFAIQIVAADILETNRIHLKRAIGVGVVDEEANPVGARRQPGRQDTPVILRRIQHTGHPDTPDVNVINFDLDAVVVKAGVIKAALP